MKKGSPSQSAIFRRIPHPSSLIPHPSFFASLVRSIDMATMRPACAETSNKGLCAGLSSVAVWREAAVAVGLARSHDRRLSKGCLDDQPVF